MKLDMHKLSHMKRAGIRLYPVYVSDLDGSHPTTMYSYAYMRHGGLYGGPVYATRADALDGAVAKADLLLYGAPRYYDC